MPTSEHEQSTVTVTVLEGLSPGIDQSDSPVRRVPILRLWDRRQDDVPVDHLEEPGRLPGTGELMLEDQKTADGAGRSEREPRSVGVFGAAVLRASASGALDVRVYIERVQEFFGSWNRVSGARLAADLGRLQAWFQHRLQLLEQECARSVGFDDTEQWLTRAAKELAECSRDSGEDLRSVRYRLEASVSRALSRGSAPGTQLVAHLVDLNLFASKTADRSDHAIREGLALWVTDSRSYHRYRQRRDPSLIVEYAELSDDEMTALKTYDAAMRQCENLSRGLREDGSAIAGLLASLASLSASEEAETQERFSAIASVAGLILGVPALLLALYSVQAFAGLDLRARGNSVFPLIVPFAAAAIIAMVFLRKKALTMWLALGTIVIIGALFMWSMFQVPGAT